MNRTSNTALISQVTSADFSMEELKLLNRRLTNIVLEKFVDAYFGVHPTSEDEIKTFVYFVKQCHTVRVNEHLALKRKNEQLFVNISAMNWRFVKALVDEGINIYFVKETYQEYLSQVDFSKMLDDEKEFWESVNNDDRKRTWRDSRRSSGTNGTNDNNQTIKRRRTDEYRAPLNVERVNGNNNMNGMNGNNNNMRATHSPISQSTSSPRLQQNGGFLTSPRVVGGPPINRRYSHSHFKSTDTLSSVSAPLPVRSVAPLSARGKFPNAGTGTKPLKKVVPPPPSPPPASETVTPSSNNTTESDEFKPSSPEYRPTSPGYCPEDKNRDNEDDFEFGSF
jgi:hypothetical protein